jgi:hypothetical protein
MATTFLKGLVLAFSLAFAAAQEPDSCSSISTCSSCAGADARYEQYPCAWCPDYNGCVPSNSGYCNGRQTVSSPRDCPVPLTVQVAAWQSSDALGTLAIAGVAVVTLAVAAFSSVERACGRRASDGAALAREWGVAPVFAGAALLWTSLSLLLASPAAPWITALEGQQSYYYTTAFATFTCSQDTSVEPPTHVCQSLSLSYYKRDGLTGSQNLSLKITSGQVLGAFGLIFALGLLLPAALMASIATYRLSMLRRYGEAPYTAGCSLASLAVAQALAWTGFALTCVVWFAALGLCRSLVENDLKYVGSSITYAASPGSVLMALAAAAALVGAALVSAAARATRDVLGVGCNRGGCCGRGGGGEADPLLARAGAERGGAGAAPAKAISFMTARDI